MIDMREQNKLLARRRSGERKPAVAIHRSVLGL
jgi:hypothetical protein